MSAGVGSYSSAPFGASVDVDADVVVAGAGPAGIAAAVAVARLRPDLARRGRVLCFDKARFPREKPCGGGLTGHARQALDTLELAVRVPTVACPTGRIVYGRESRTVTLERPVEVVRREEFDADLVAQARDHGVRVFEGEGITAHAVDRERGVVTVTTALGRGLTARVLVAADGAGSRIRKQVMAGGRQQPERPLRLYKLEMDLPAAAPREMIYDFSPMESGLRGYVWLFPVSGGRLNVGAMHTQSRRLSAAEILGILAATLARHGITLPTNARGWPAWPYAPRARLSMPHVLCVGDAAGIDALTGEGIAVGLEHGPLAGAAIARALSTGDFAFSGFTSDVRAATVGRELALDQRLADLLYAPRGYRFWLSLVMFDQRMREMYAARVCGSDVLADRRAALFAAFARHAVAAPLRLRRMARALT
ncbi:MAG: FAD-dependent oxidoreductase [Pseudomonadota bacterium]